jgi:hypothetical protein
MSKKIIIIGSRRRDAPDDYKTVWQEFRKWYEPGDIIVSGGCPKGGDRFAEVIASKLNMNEENGQLIIHLPKKPPQGSPRYVWAKAMYERNTVVANEAEADTVVIACVSPDRKGGTEDTLKKIKRKKVLKELTQIRIV